LRWKLLSIPSANIHLQLTFPGPGDATSMKISQKQTPPVNLIRFLFNEPS
jgi:hypothetical protein